MNIRTYSKERCDSKVPNALKELLEYLEGLTERASMEKLGELLSALNVSRDDLEAFVNFGDLTYRRNLIAETDWFELLCICWKSGQRSPIHNHEGSTCGLRIIEGTATETIFDRTPSGQYKAIRSMDFSQDLVCTSQDSDVHQVSNLQAAGSNLITLHIYSPPLRTMETYSLLGEVNEYRPTNFMSCEYGDGI